MHQIIITTLVEYYSIPPPLFPHLSSAKKVSPLAQSVIKDYKEFFPDLDVPEILYKISQQKKSPKAYEPSESDGA